MKKTRGRKSCETVSLSDFFSFLGLNTHFRAGRYENKEKRLFYFGLRILLPNQIQLLKIENKKIQNRLALLCSELPYCQI
jgi:hypothetical protein